jgi:hypothetical protein
MALSEVILKKINKKFEPDTWVQLKFRSYDIALKTDEEGNAIQMFIGKLKEDGMIRGERYSRRIIKDSEGNILKQHWDRKGKTS